MGRPQERRRAVFEQPLHREDGPRLCAVALAFLFGRSLPADPYIHVRALIDQQLDEVEVVHVGRAHGIVAAFDVSVIGREIKRRPAAVVGEIRIRAMLQQISANLVVPVLRRGQQRGPAVMRGLVDIGACFHQ